MNYYSADTGIEFMEMPTPCERCGNVFDLYDGVSSPRSNYNIVICSECGEKEESEVEREEEIADLKEQISDAEESVAFFNDQIVEAKERIANATKRLQELSQSL